MTDGKFKVVKLDGEAYKDEFAIVTPVIDGNEFDELKEQLKADYQILGSLRLVGEQW